MKIIKNRYLIAGLCLLAAGIIAFAVLPQFYSGREATTTVYRAGVSIPQGTLIEQSHIVSVEVGAFNLPDSAITDSKDIIGQYALTNIPKDDLLLPDKLGAFLHSESLDKLMKRNQRLVTVSLPSTAAGVAGHLEPGDVVSVVCYIKAYERFITDEATGFDVRENVPAETVLYPELQSITVYNIENAKTERVEDLTNAEGTSVDIVPKTVTLIVTEEQALKLVEAEYTGNIHLVFEKRGK